MEKKPLIFRTYDRGNYDPKQLDEMYWDCKQPFNMVQILRENTSAMGDTYYNFDNREYGDVCSRALAETSPCRDSKYRMMSLIVEGDNLIDHGYTDEEMDELQQYNTVAPLYYLQRLRDELAMLKHRDSIDDTDITALSVKVDMLTDRINCEGDFKRSEHCYDPDALYLITGEQLFRAGCDLGVRPQDQVAVAYTVSDIHLHMQDRDWFTEKDERQQMDICQDLADRMFKSNFNELNDKFAESLNSLSDIDAYK